MVLVWGLLDCGPLWGPQLFVNFTASHVLQDQVKQLRNACNTHQSLVVVVVAVRFGTYANVIVLDQELKKSWKTE
eukprot:1818892-Amphidinium_carterae.1